MIAETAPFIPEVDFDFIDVPFTNVSGLKLAAGNYWIFASAELDTCICSGNSYPTDETNTPAYNACGSYSNGNTGYTAGQIQYDYRYNLLPASITWIFQDGNYNIAVILTNN